MASFLQSIEEYKLFGAAGVIEVALHLPITGGELSASNMVAVVCHPHPLYGGTMDNKVVTTLSRCYRELGIPVARFNFRGVGASAGRHDGSVGETDDLLVVVDWLRERYGAKQVLLAGFSFGSAVAALGSFRVPDIKHLVLVAPPVDRYPYERGGKFAADVCVIMGDQDELVDAEGVFLWAKGLLSSVALIRMPEATHFFHGRMTALRNDLTAVLLKALS